MILNPLKHERGNVVNFVCKRLFFHLQNHNRATEIQPDKTKVNLPVRFIGFLL